jgi:Xaa-Pro aminopeptidase
VAALASVLKSLIGGAKNIGLEASALLHGDALALKDTMSDRTWQRAEDLVMSQRLIKDAAELDLLREAARITDGAYTHALKHIRLGMTEKDLAAVINDYLRTHSEGCSFNTIVGFGETASAPHYEPNPKRKLEKGHIILMDFGSIHEGYMGDMTRMAVAGPADDRQKQMYAWVLEAQEAVLSKLAPGITGHEADKAARDVFEKHGVIDKFLHGTGHGIGLAVHEPPKLKPSLENKLVPGTVFSVEPGLYEAGWGGIRIEDLVIMTDKGPENITQSPKKDLIEIAC